MATTTVTFQWEILHWNYGGNNARNSSQISMGNYFFSIGNIGELGRSIPVIFQWKKLFLPLKLWGSSGVYFQSLFNRKITYFTIEIMGELSPLIPVKFQWKKNKLPLKLSGSYGA